MAPEGLACADGRVMSGRRLAGCTRAVPQVSVIGGSPTGGLR